MERSATDAEEPGLAAAATGVVIRVALVAPGRGRASGTFTAVGGVRGRGAALTALFRSFQPRGAAPVPLDGDVTLDATLGGLVAALTAVVRRVPGTSVLTGGGTWTLTAATGAYDGLRAAGTATAIVAHEQSGAAALDLVLVGRVTRDVFAAEASASRHVGPAPRR